MRADVAIVGAGPAGVAAAVTAARAGLDVVLVDKATFPRDKCCGDGLTTLALRLLEDLGLRPGRRALVDRGRRRVGALAVRAGRRAADAAGPGPVRRRRPARRARRRPRRSGPLGRRQGPRRPRPHSGQDRRRERRGAGRRRRRDGRRALRRRGRRHVVAAAQAPRPRPRGLPRRVARLSPVLPRRHRHGGRAALDLVRTRPPAWLRVVVPAARRAGQRRLRRAPGRRPAHPGHEGRVGRPAGAAAHPRRRSDPTPRPKPPTRPGRSLPASTGSCSAGAGRCSSATRRRPPTR